MGKHFDWISDVSRGDWLRTVEDEFFGSLWSIVPRNYEAVARIFHPVRRDRPTKTGTWHGVDPQKVFTDEFDDDDIEEQLATWADVAQAFGKALHAQAQFQALMPPDHKAAAEIGADGWRYSDPEQGNLDADVLTTVAVVLAQHTNTPDDGVAAVWEGWGGLTSSAGFARFYAMESGPKAVFHNLWQQLKNRLPHRQPKPGTGVLPKDVAAGPRFELHEGTGRSYILFSAGANQFANPQWHRHAPWVNRQWYPQSPSILWPKDQAWVLATEIDYDSTLVAGSMELIRALVAADGLEGAVLPHDADLSVFGDRINNPNS